MNCTSDNIHLSHNFFVSISTIDGSSDSILEFYAVSFKLAYQKASDMWYKSRPYKKCKKEFVDYGNWCEVWKNDGQVCTIEQSKPRTSRFIFNSVGDSPSFAYIIITKDNPHNTDILEYKRIGPDVVTTTSGILVKLFSVGVLIDPGVISGWKSGSTEIMKVPHAHIMLIGSVVYVEIYIRNV